MVQKKRIPVEVYSRVVGYYRPVNQWNKGKQEEFRERSEFTKEEIIGACLNENKRDTEDIAC